MIKYKPLAYIKDINKLPLRIRSLKRGRWAFFKTRLLKETTKKFSSPVYDSVETIVLPGFWNKLSKTYKSNILLRHKYSYVFSTKMKRPANKNRLSSLDTYYLPYYSPKFLLALLSFTVRENQSKFFFIKRSIFVNNLILRDPSILLNKGDVVCLKDKVDIKKNYSKFSFFFNYVSTVEVDAYSQQFILVKSLDEMSEEDFVNLNFENFNYF